jgi:hypothetical protein
VSGDDLATLWHRDGLAGLRTRARNASRSLQGLQDRASRYARTIGAARDAWAAAAAAFDRSWRDSGLLADPSGPCPDCGAADDPFVRVDAPDLHTHLRQLECVACGATWSERTDPVLAG